LGRGLGGDRGEPARARSPGRRAARAGDPERARPGRDLRRRQEASSARGVDLSSERPTLEAPKVGGTTTATGTEEHDAGEPMQPNPPELPHPGGDDPEIPGAPREGGPGGTGV